MLSLEKVKSELKRYNFDYSHIVTQSMKIEMKINKIIANNSWIKDNINHLKTKNYFNPMQ